MVGICNLPPVYSNKNKSRDICNSSDKLGKDFKPNLVVFSLSFTKPNVEVLLS